MQQEEVVYIYLDDIIPNRFQPREIFEERPLKELAISIKEHGVIQPIIVRKVNDKYEIIAGERRYKASALAGLTKIPAIVRDLDDKETSKVALLENLQRKNLNPLEEARTYQKILEIDEMTQEELAKTMGKSQSSVANKLRLLSLSEEVQQALLKEEISERHARAILSIENQEKQKEILKEVIDNKMTVRQLEEKIKQNEQSPISIIQEEIKVEEPKMIIPEESKQILDSNNFITTTPLMPNFNVEETKEEPLLKGSILTGNTNEQQESNNSFINDNNSQNKFINFGEIKEEKNNNNNDFNFFSNNENTNSQNDTNTFNFSQEKETGDLDNLLKIGNSGSLISSNSENSTGGSLQFFSPAAEAIKESETNRNSNTNEDYFKAPDFLNLGISNINENMLISNESISVGNSNGENKLDDAIKIIKEAISKIEAKGIKVEKDEMNLEKSFQIIIKLEK